MDGVMVETIAKQILSKYKLVGLSYSDEDIGSIYSEAVTRCIKTLGNLHNDDILWVFSDGSNIEMNIKTIITEGEE